MALGRGLGSLIPTFKNSSVKDDASAVRKSVVNLSGEPAGDKSGRIWQIPLTAIKANPYQPRQNFAHQDLEELVNSIKEYGIIQPIILSESNDGEYELIAGERRFRSAQILNLATVPAIIRQAKNLEKLELALIENIQRKNLNPIEEAFAYERLVDEFGLTHDDVSKKVGKSRPYVSNTLRLLSLPQEIQKGLIDGIITHTLGRAILGLSTAKEQLKMYHQAVAEKGTVQAVERKVEAKRLETTGLTRREPAVIDYERQLREVLGTKVRVTKRGEKGNIKIDYFSLEELKRIIKTIASK
ncbi:MAG: ParB/RepB/Spo0J family partition protein [Candidatus Magasanikbacteria bacterium]|nr:ParB/RepB/Spo0J family partition protein [Candidatus Magasanikbacteria bacterium]